MTAMEYVKSGLNEKFREWAEHKANEAKSQEQRILLLNLLIYKYQKHLLERLEK